MKILKKFSVLLLAVTMVIGSIFVGSKTNSYAATSYIKQLVIGKTYKCDLDGDGDKDSIKLYKKGQKLYLNVNKTTKKLVSNYNPNNNLNMAYEDCIVRIYDLNKKDKTLDIVATIKEEDGYNQTRIIKFKNNVCKIDKTWNAAIINSYNSSTGMVTFKEDNRGRYSNFEKVMGCFEIFDNVKVNGYKTYNQYTADTSKTVNKHKYISAKNLNAYTNTNGNKKAFTIKKNSKVYVYAIYQNGNKKYIKVKNSAGKYGYVKVGTSMVFTNKSCLWWG